MTVVVFELLILGLTVEYLAPQHSGKRHSALGAYLRSLASMTLRITTLSITILRITTLRITTNNTQDNNKQHSG
jgi:hypothetical protein